MPTVVPTVMPTVVPTVMPTVMPTVVPVIINGTWDSICPRLLSFEIVQRRLAEFCFFSFVYKLHLNVSFCFHCVSSNCVCLIVHFKINMASYKHSSLAQDPA